MSLNPIIALDHVIEEYRDHLQSECRARDRALRGALQGELDRPLFLAQEPFYQVHRPFRAGQRWADLPLDPALVHDQYAHVLSTFSHSSYKEAPRQCLAAFDELQSLGLEAFTKKHDPYWDIPLNGNLPQPVIDPRSRQPHQTPRPPGRTATFPISKPPPRRHPPAVHR